MFNKDSQRALRRHHAARLKLARQFYGGRTGEDSTPAHRGRMLTHPATCSGPCCGNSRKWFGEKTIQERRHEQRKAD